MQILQVLVDPFDPSHLLASTHYPGGLLESRDGGATWSGYIDSLPGGNSLRGAFCPVTEGTVLAALDPSLGPYISESPAELGFHDISTGLEAGISGNWSVRALAVA